MAKMKLEPDADMWQAVNGSTIQEHTTFMTASVCSRSHPTSACPDSWKATTLCSSFERILLFFALPEDTQNSVAISATSIDPEWPVGAWGVGDILPAMTLSTACSKFNVSMCLCPSLAACSAASLQMLAMSAPAQEKRVCGRVIASCSGNMGQRNVKPACQR